VSAAPLALVGPTATGKTALAVAYARVVGDVELVSCDAFSVYRGLDIGTAKPTVAERAGLAWHLLDLVEPDEEFSVAAYRAAAEAAIAGIEGRGHRVLLVGGTGLYVRAVTDALEPPGRFPEFRSTLEVEAAGPGGPEALHRHLVELDPLAASRMEPSNVRRVVRALEVTLGSGRPFSSFGPGLGIYAPTRFTLVGLRVSRDTLAMRIAARLERQLACGFLDEVEALRHAPKGMSRTAREALGYRELAAYLDGRCSLEEARREIERRTRALARRQEAWFGRDPRIVWLDPSAADPLDALMRLGDQGSA